MRGLLLQLLFLRSDMKRNNQRAASGALRLTMSGVMSGLGVTLLYIGSVFEVLDITLAALASFIIVFFVMEFSKLQAFAVFTVTGTLALLLLPNKFPAVMYFVFIGYYPILKAIAEKKLKKVSAYAFKLIIFNAALFTLIFLARRFFRTPENVFALEVAFVALANLTFVVYDFALTRLISFYFYKLRPRLRFRKK